MSDSTKIQGYLFDGSYLTFDDIRDYNAFSTFGEAEVIVDDWKNDIPTLLDNNSNLSYDTIRASFPFACSKQSGTTILVKRGRAVLHGVLIELEEDMAIEPVLTNSTGNVWLHYNRSTKYAEIITTTSNPTGYVNLNAFNGAPDIYKLLATYTVSNNAIGTVTSNVRIPVDPASEKILQPNFRTYMNLYPMGLRRWFISASDAATIGYTASYRDYILEGGDMITYRDVSGTITTVLADQFTVRFNVKSFYNNKVLGDGRGISRDVIIKRAT